MSKAMTAIKTAGAIAPVLPVRKTALQPLGLEGHRYGALSEAGQSIHRAPRPWRAEGLRVRTLLLPGRHPGPEATVLRGHAVRALYLSAGAIDAGVELDDTELVDAIELQYQNTLARRAYITGGMGSHHQDEAFGSDFELPPDRAYCETCAGIASVMVAWRLLLAR